MRYACAALLTSAVLSSTALATKRIVLYDPDANHEAILNIALWFDRYLKSVDPTFEFQAVQRLSFLRQDVNFK